MKTMMKLTLSLTVLLAVSACSSLDDSYPSGDSVYNSYDYGAAATEGYVSGELMHMN